jgi:hypothetical protein
MCKSYTVINNAIIHQQIENGEHWTSTRTPTVDASPALNAGRTGCG